MSSLLTKKAVNHIFTALRKAANHPLLGRQLVTESEAKNLAAILYADGAFGGATQDMIEKELTSYSDVSEAVLCLSVFYPF